ncbi:glycoside hydrolase family 65 protein [Amphibacillus sp. Q70]|uniref:glycoside hydrolase family 65 protein n=1 Tax=Amphibacillus sp. Q70 TaxID=3453416 RepID=UPI003F872DE5
MAWNITRKDINKDKLLLNESLFAIGNGYIGVRGNFEEGYGDAHPSIRGTYINAFHDESKISYGEKLAGFPESQQKMLNVIEAQTIKLLIDGEELSLFDGEVIDYEQSLHFKEGYFKRKFHWRSPAGKEILVTIRRMTSFVRKELFAIEYFMEPLSHIDELTILSTIDGDVSNFVDDNDPRVASGHAKYLSVTDIKQEEELNMIISETQQSKLSVACVSSTELALANYDKEVHLSGTSIEEKYTVLFNKPVLFTKRNIYTDTLRHGDQLDKKGKSLHRQAKEKSFSELLEEQHSYLNEYWDTADIYIKGDPELQEGIRFNLFQLLQSVGKDSVSNIAAKGLSGEGYEGHYFWDSEIYIFPIFLMTNHEIARSLLLQRYSLLDSARERAKEVGHTKGALFPWRTITGKESSAFFPAGTAQYHISADIAYSYIKYFLVTNDMSFMEDYGAEVLFETARLWLDTGHFYQGTFRIDDVTGPDEYTCIVNNNYYTNAMAKYNLEWAAKIYNLLKENNKLSQLIKKIDLKEDEVADWARASEQMFLPYDEELGINAQDDTFLQKKVWDLKNTPKEKFPLLLHYHPLTLYRYQVCKQADTVLAHFLLDGISDMETVKNSYDYYEKVTTHDSSLSHCAFSVMASKLGYSEKAYKHFSDTARLDLNNLHGNTKDGLHMASMGGTWLAIVYGFAGLRIKESGLSFTPTLPQEWEALKFKIQYQQRLLMIELHSDTVTYTLEKGADLVIKHYDEEITLKTEQKTALEYHQSPMV